MQSSTRLIRTYFGYLDELSSVHGTFEGLQPQIHIKGGSGFEAPNCRCFSDFADVVAKIAWALERLTVNCPWQNP